MVFFLGIPGGVLSCILAFCTLFITYKVHRDNMSGGLKFGFCLGCICFIVAAACLLFIAITQTACCSAAVATMII